MVRTWCFHCQPLVQSLVGKLRSHRLCRKAKKKKAFMNHKEKKQGNEAKKITFKIEIKYTKIFYHSNR